MALTLFGRKKESIAGLDVPVRTPRRVAPPAPAPDSLLADFVASRPAATSDDPLRRMLDQARFGLIVENRDKCVAQPGGRDVYNHACAEIEQRFALVPGGMASIAQTLTDQPESPVVEEEVAPFYFAIHMVTNREFQHFVDDGAYDNMDLWPQDILPYLIEFHDLTGSPGPRFWREGRHDERRTDHPVVGISWYEASAFTAWAGYRLPTEAEWQMAASWRVKSSADLLRRFPWGDAMDCTRCNLWNSGMGTTVPVHEYPTGAAPNGILQLIGNAWEWTASEFTMLADDQTPVVGEMPMMGVRGGAFDTYFESQATSTFRSGQITLGRTHNVGFRCALDQDTAPIADES